MKEEGNLPDAGFPFSVRASTKISYKNGKYSAAIYFFPIFLKYLNTSSCFLLFILYRSEGDGYGRWVSCGVFYDRAASWSIGTILRFFAKAKKRRICLPGPSRWGTARRVLYGNFDRIGKAICD